MLLIYDKLKCQTIWQSFTFEGACGWNWRRADGRDSNQRRGSGSETDPVATPTGELRCRRWKGKTKPKKDTIAPSAGERKNSQYYKDKATTSVTFESHNFTVLRKILYQIITY